MAELAAEKHELRRRARANRAALAGSIGPSAGPEIRDQFLTEISCTPGTIVAGYWPMEEEADVRPLLQALHGQGALCALPVMQGRDQPLEFRRWSPDDEMAENSFGIHEPTSEAEIVTPQLLLVPLLAFDGDGYRLGQGGGYYDRTLAVLRAQAAPPFAVGIAFTGQEVDRVPRDSFDQGLDWVVTETHALPFD